MSAANSNPSPSKALFYTGWVLSVLPCLLFLMSASMKLKDPAAAAAQTEEYLHWKITNPNLLLYLGIVELVSVTLYLVHQNCRHGRDFAYWLYGWCDLHAFAGGRQFHHANSDFP